MAEDYFNKVGLDYEKIDLTTSPDAVKWVKNNTGQLGVPVIKIGDKIIIGFDRPTIEQVLKDS
jgi:glutaredoxin